MGLTVKDVYIDILHDLNNKVFDSEYITFVYCKNGSINYIFRFYAGHWSEFSSKYKNEIDRIMDNYYDDKSYGTIYGEITLTKFNSIYSVKFACLDEEYNIDSIYAEYLVSLFKKTGAKSILTELDFVAELEDPISDESILIDICKDNIKERLRLIESKKEFESKSLLNKIKKIMFN